MEIDRHLGCAMSGLTADARTIVDHARVTAQNHTFTYDEPIKVESVTQAVCDLALRFGEGVHGDEAMMVMSRSSLKQKRFTFSRFTDARFCTYIDQSRPFGVALLIAGLDELGPQLYSATILSCRGRRYLIFILGSTPTLLVHLLDTPRWQWGVAPKRRKASYKINTTRQANTRFLASPSGC